MVWAHHHCPSTSLILLIIRGLNCFYIVGERISLAFISIDWLFTTTTKKKGERESRLGPRFS